MLHIYAVLYDTAHHETADWHWTIALLILLCYMDTAHLETVNWCCPSALSVGFPNVKYAFYTAYPECVHHSTDTEHNGTGNMTLNTVALHIDTGRGDARNICKNARHWQFFTLLSSAFFLCPLHRLRQRANISKVSLCPALIGTLHPKLSGHIPSEQWNK